MYGGQFPYYGGYGGGSAKPGLCPNPRRGSYGDDDIIFDFDDRKDRELSTYLHNAVKYATEARTFSEREARASDDEVKERHFGGGGGGGGIGLGAGFGGYIGGISPNYGAGINPYYGAGSSPHVHVDTTTHSHYGGNLPHSHYGNYGGYGGGGYGGGYYGSGRRTCSYDADCPGREKCCQVQIGNRGDYTTRCRCPTIQA